MLSIISSLVTFFLWPVVCERAAAERLRRCVCVCLCVCVCVYSSYIYNIKYILYIYNIFNAYLCSIRELAAAGNAEQTYADQLWISTTTALSTAFANLQVALKLLVYEALSY